MVLNEREGESDPCVARWQQMLIENLTFLVPLARPTTTISGKKQGGDCRRLSHRHLIGLPFFRDLPRGTETMERVGKGEF